MKANQRNPPQKGKGLVQPLKIAGSLAEMTKPVQSRSQGTEAPEKQGMTEAKVQVEKTVGDAVEAGKKIYKAVKSENSKKNFTPKQQSVSRPSSEQNKTVTPKPAENEKKDPDVQTEPSANQTFQLEDLSSMEAPPKPQAETPELIQPIDVTKRAKDAKVRPHAEKNLVQEEKQISPFVQRETIFVGEAPKSSAESTDTPRVRTVEERSIAVREAPKYEIIPDNQGYLQHERPVQKESVFSETTFAADKKQGRGFSVQDRKEFTPRSQRNRDDDPRHFRNREHNLKLRNEEGQEKNVSRGKGAELKSTTREERFAQYSQKASEAAGKTAEEAAKTAAEGAQVAGQTAQVAGEAASGAATGGVSTAISAAEKAVKKVEEALREFSREGKSPLSNDQSGVVSILTTGGGILGTLIASVGIFLLPIFLIVFAASLLFSSAGNQNLSEGVTALLPQIQAACVKYEIPDYAPLVAAIMMQESGGDVELVHGDVMQCAEGMGLPVGTPVSTEESIDFGVKLLKGLLQQANVTSPADLDHLKLAVQAYNFGSGYIGYALAMDGKYTRENAVSFAQRQAGILGWSSYGDVDYVDHVLRYYTIGTGLGMGTVSQRYPTLCYPMPGYGWTTYSGHEGIDLPCELGTPVYASGSGTITYVKNGWTEADGKSGMMSYGNCVCISHDNGLQTRYGHLSYSIVQSGQMVFQGQLIGYSGSTGNSTGPHMHFSIYDNGNPGSGGYSNNAALAFPNERQ